MELPKFGLELLHRQDRKTNYFRGFKLSKEQISSLHKLKFKKIEEIRNSHSELELYSYKQDCKVDSKVREFSETRFKVLKASPRTSRYSQIEENSLLVLPSRKKQEEEKPKQKPYYSSQNLDRNMSLYLNRLINKSEEERKTRLQQMKQKLEADRQIQTASRKSTYNPRTLFWKQMKRQLSKNSNCPSLTSRT